MSLVIYYWIGDVQDSRVYIFTSETTYIVSGGALNFTHSLFRWFELGNSGFFSCEEVQKLFHVGTLCCHFHE